MKLRIEKTKGQFYLPYKIKISVDGEAIAEQEFTDEAMANDWIERMKTATKKRTETTNLDNWIKTEEIDI